MVQEFPAPHDWIDQCSKNPIWLEKFREGASSVWELRRTGIGIAVVAGFLK